MNINKMLDDYTKWLRDEISVAKFGQYYELTTPYLDRFNDYMQLYVKMDEDEKITITDDGYILSNLEMSGIKFKTESAKKRIFDKTLRNFGIELRDKDLVTTCSVDNFSQRKHMMVQAMLSIDDMFYLKKETVKDIFVEEIANFFNTNEIFFSPDFSLIGKTGSLYTYDFHFQRNKSNPERFCRGINRLNQSKRDMAIFNWIDTKDKRSGDSQLIIIINDENKVAKEDLSALKVYEITPVLFSEKEKNIELFAS